MPDDPQHGKLCVDDQSPNRFFGTVIVGKFQQCFFGDIKKFWLWIRISSKRIQQFSDIHTAVNRW